LLVPVILSGGVGSRLWPLSREQHPKPFIRLGNDRKSFIQTTYERALALGSVSEVVTVTNRDLFFFTKDEFDDIDGVVSNTFLLEPVGRNSAAAIAVAAHYLNYKYGDDTIMLVMPADHLIEDITEFQHAFDTACNLAQHGGLVTFGIVPQKPDTGMGYIEASGNLVRRFIEKPSQDAAEEYIRNGNFLWNSGIFCMKAGVFVNELKSLCKDIDQQTYISFKSAKYSSGNNWQCYEMNKNDFGCIRDISVDYAVFERSTNVMVVPCNIGWTDIGSWSEFGALFPSDDNNNHICGDVITEDTYNSIIHADSGRMIATIGIDGVIVADSEDAILVAGKRHSQDVRKIVKKLKDSGSLKYKDFPTVHRPWGTYTVLYTGAGFKLKCIEVRQGESLSLQSHDHRSEHWVVVSGVATVVKDTETFELGHNQSTYIPVGVKHRLANLGSDTLLMIEVQCGVYLGEDDIVRYEDIYDRGTA